VEKESFGRFGKSFQESLCQLILEDRPFADQITEVLEPSFLELRYLRVFIRRILSYRKEYSVHPTYKIMIPIIRSEFEEENPATKKQLRDFFARIYTCDIEGAGYIKKTSLEFCRKQVLKKAMLRSVDLLQKASFDEIALEINSALKLGSDTNFGYDYLKDFEKRFETKSRNPISTGFPELDSITEGGLGRGELGVVIAPTGSGKSMAMVHLGAQALKDGLNVIYYTLELADTTIARRFDSCLTGVPLNEVCAHKELIYENTTDLDGILIIKEYPTKSATTQTIKSHLEKLLNRDIKPNMIIVDYGDLLRPITVYREKRMNLESIYEELRGLAQEFACPLWTCSQTNRSGLNAEVITMESISEAFSKCFVADFIFSLSRTVEDKQNNTGRFFIAKNRNGPDGIVYPINMDTSIVKIEISNSQPTAISAKSHRDELREKYKKFKEIKKRKG
jgi:archaellum biogenesis ATPase FlaH